MRLISRLRSDLLLSFIGFGYDNYGHLSIFRTILIGGKSIIGFSEPDKYVTFVGASPVGAHCFFALLANTIGIDGQMITSSAKFFAVVLLFMPLSFLFIAFKILCKQERSTTWKVFGLLGLFLVIFIGYPSHIWFSGYFASNFATLLVLVSVGVSISSISINSKLWLIFSLSVAVFTVYSIYAVFAAVGFIAVLLSHRLQVIPSLFRISRRMWMMISITCFYYGLLVYITLSGLRSGYGASQFLVEGGISPLPIGTTMFIFGLAGLLLGRYQLETKEGSATSLIAQGLIVLASTGMIYAHFILAKPGEAWYVPYYPTKLTIMVILIVMVLLIDETIPRARNKSVDLVHSFQQAFFVVAAVIALVIAGHNDWPFTGGFMGTSIGVAEALNSGLSNDDIQGSLVLHWVAASDQVNRPVLVMMDANDTELRTRWVNSLTFRWTDETWGSWMKANSLIRSGEFSEATKILKDEFLVITNQKILVDALQRVDNSIEVCNAVATLSRSCDIYYDIN